MQITGSSAYYAGLDSVTTGLNRVDQAAGQIANQSVERSATSQSTDYQAERVVAAPQDDNLPADVVELYQGRTQVDVGVSMVKASNEALGTLIDTYA